MPFVDANRSAFGRLESSFIPRGAFDFGPNDKFKVASDALQATGNTAQVVITGTLTNPTIANNSINISGTNTTMQFSNPAFSFGSSISPCLMVNGTLIHMPTTP